MIKIDTRTQEKLIFNIGLTGIRQPDQVQYRLIMSVQEDMSISFKGVYNDGELIFNIPTLKDIIPVLDKQEVPFFIEMVVDDYYQIIYESEMELLNPPQVEITKLTHIKPEIEEEAKPIKIEQKIIVKPKSKFSESFNAYVKESEKEL